MADNFLEEMRNMTQNIEETIISVRSGNMPDTSGMEQKADALCKEIMAAPEDVAQQLRPQMSVMISRLEELIHEIGLYKERITEQDNSEL
jgi:hypothetical protein